jgi:hypothetical protein
MEIRSFRSPAGAALTAAAAGLIAIFAHILSSFMLLPYLAGKLHILFKVDDICHLIINFTPCFRHMSIKILTPEAW